MTITSLQVSIIMGSDSDWPVLKSAGEVLTEFDIGCEASVLSAHRTPEATVSYVEDAVNRDVKVFIAAAGMAAHLAGVVAAHTIVPVLGVPMQGGMLDGLDALLSTIQMPPGIPVATFGVGKPGAINAALFAVAIIASEDTPVGRVAKLKLMEYRKQQTNMVLAKKVEL